MKEDDGTLLDFNITPLLIAPKQEELNSPIQARCWICQHVSSISLMQHRGKDSYEHEGCRKAYNSGRYHARKAEEGSDLICDESSSPAVSKGHSQLYCWLCKQNDDPSNLSRFGSANQFAHIQCRRQYQRQRRLRIKNESPKS
jgi:hypothetical protein